MPHVRPAVLVVAYATFVLIGISGGAGGVLLPSQMATYGVSRSVIGITFFSFSVGFVLSSLSTGALVGRLGARVSLVAGGGALALSGLYLATRPPFAAFVLAQVVTGWGMGVLESVLNVCLAALPGATTLLNRLHAFWGIGALLGPPLAAWIIGFTSWTVVWLIVAAACVPLLAGFLLAYPGPTPEPEAPPPGSSGTTATIGTSAVASRSVLGAALRDRGIALGATMLAVYVGLEVGVGNWGFSYLVQGRALSQPLAGWAVSGYWLGLTLGRFLISPIAARARATTAGMIYACLAGVTLAWHAGLAVAGRARLRGAGPARLLSRPDLPDNDVDRAAADAGPPGAHRHRRHERGGRGGRLRAALAGGHPNPGCRDVGADAVRPRAGPSPLRHLACHHQPTGPVGRALRSSGAGRCAFGPLRLASAACRAWRTESARPHSARNSTIPART